MKALARGVAALVLLAAVGPARAGHEAPIYPSFYPQEIRIEPMDPRVAGEALASGRIHAYVGATPTFAARPGKSIQFVESFGGYVIVRLNPRTPFANDTKASCAATRSLIARLARDVPGFVFHPYPVNGFHADYLYHADLAAAARARLRDYAHAPAGGIRLRARGALARQLVPGALAPDTPEWDAEVAEVPLARVLAGATVAFNAWSGPPWRKQGWFQAYLLLADGLTDRVAKARAKALATRLLAGRYASAEERINLERALVSLLAADCREAVAGYAVRREAYSAEYTGGIENIAYDSQAGFDSAIFLRTVKLKDFPWNGWLTLGVASPPTAAWNPIAGFSDAAGRLIWSALGDPALFPAPYGGDWTLNRIGSVRPTGGIRATR